MAALGRLRTYFEENVGKIINKSRLAEVAGISEWARRVRELRDDEGMQILTHNDRDDLKPGEYILISSERRPRISHKIDAQTRTRILMRNGFTCIDCGRTAGDLDPLNPSRKVRLHIDHIDPNGPPVDSNLRVLCSACNKGRSNITLPRTTINLLASIRRASREDQLAALDWLKRKYGL